MVHFDSTMIIVRRQGDDHLIQGYLHSGGNALVQLSRMVLEKGRLRRPERFLQFLRMVHFRRKCTMRKNCNHDPKQSFGTKARRSQRKTGDDLLRESEETKPILQ